MRTLGKVAVLAGVVAAQAGEKTRFEPRPATEYAHRQTVEKVTIAVEPFEDREEMKQAFGKTDPGKWGVLPVLLVLANDTDRALHLANMRVQLITASGQKADSIPGDEVEKPRPTGRHSPFPVPSPIPGGIPRPGKGQSKSMEIAAREFVAPMAAPRGTVHGFFFFRVGKAAERLADSRLYITGIRDARTGQELFYFEIALGGDSGKRGRN